MKRIGIFSVGMLAAFWLASFQLLAQGETEKKAVKIGLTYTQANDDGPVLKVTTKVKVGKKFEAVGGVEVNLSFMSDTPQSLLARVKTDRTGKASLALATAINAKLDSLSPFKFIATITENKDFEAEPVEVEITRARIELTPTVVDSIRKVTAKVFALTGGKWTPVPQAEVKLVVKRLFNDMLISQTATPTDEEGIASVDFGITIPGDVDGNIILGAKIDDSDVYGSIQATKSVKWGVPLKADDSFSKRTLWASRDKTPLWLLIFPNVIIATVWGFIIYLVFLIRSIRKIGMVK